MLLSMLCFLLCCNAVVWCGVVLRCVALRCIVPNGIILLVWVKLVVFFIFCDIIQSVILSAMLFCIVVLSVVLCFVASCYVVLLFYRVVCPIPHCGALLLVILLEAS